MYTHTHTQVYTRVYTPVCAPSCSLLDVEASPMATSAVLAPSPPCCCSPCCCWPLLEEVPCGACECVCVCLNVLALKSTSHACNCTRATFIHTHARYGRCMYAFTNNNYVHMLQCIAHECRCCTWVGKGRTKLTPTPTPPTHTHTYTPHTPNTPRCSAWPLPPLRSSRPCCVG